MNEAAATGDGERVLFEGRPAVIAGVGELLISVLTLGIAALFYWMRSLGTHYRLTTRRLVVESGLLSKRLEQVEVHRINDFVVERPFGQRLLGTGNLTMRTLDETTPTFAVRGIRTDVKALYESLRQAAEDERKRRGVRILE